jgi:hypothetical protein
LRQEYSARPRPEIPCAASDCSSWPSPAAGNFNDGEDLASFDARKARLKAKCLNGNGMGDSLAITAARSSNWSAPKATDGEKGGPNQRGSRGDLQLPSQAAQWPGPMAHEARLGYQRRPADLVGSQQSLSTIAADFRPPSSPDQPIAGGSMSSTDGPNSNQPSVRRKLNPIFVEALMRWPTGLSGFERQEMAWIQWWLLMPSFVSALVSPSMQTRGQMALPL